MPAVSPCPVFKQEIAMHYIRKRSLRLRRLAALRLRSIRRALRKIDLSLSIQLNLVVLKVTLTFKRRE